MIYIEFTSRRPQPGLRENDRGTLAVESFESQVQRFHRAVLAGQSGWEGSWSEDQMILSMGRTWRLGPEPEYMTVWYTPTAGLGRIDDWDTVFRSGDADALEKPFREVARIERAGCYEALLDPVRQSATSGVAERSEASPRPQNGIYYAEFFEPVGSDDEIRELYVEARRVTPEFDARAVHRPDRKACPGPRGSRGLEASLLWRACRDRAGPR